MKIAVLYKLNNPLSIEEVEIPQLKSGQVLVQLKYSGVCHSQLMEARGMRGEDRFLPHTMGHEGTGIVKAVGSGVTKIAPGDAVVLGWIKGQGLDGGGTQYVKGDTKINAGGVTTFSDHAVVSENRLVKLPEGVPYDVGVLFGCAIPTGSGIVMNEIKPKPNSTIALFGMGGIGLSALMATKLFQCSRVIAVDVEDSKLELAKNFGATDVINSTKENPVTKIMEMTQGQGVDYSVDAAGMVKTIEQAFESIKMKSGLCIFASHPKHGEKISIDPFHLICGKQIKGSWGGGSNPDVDIPKFGDLYRKGQLPLEKLLSPPFKIQDINHIFDLLEDRKLNRALISFE